MTATPASDLAFRVADQLRAPGPWDIVAERLRRFELHFNGTEIEVERGPLTIEGYGVRLFRPRGDGLGTGFQASTDASAQGIETVVRDAEASARFAEFPAKSVELPTGRGPGTSVSVVDPKLWDDPAKVVRAYTDALLRPFQGRKGAVPSFGSVKATLGEVSIANSAGLRVGYTTTSADLEIAVKAFGGAEGAPPGEYWVTGEMRRLVTDGLEERVGEWCRYAEDVRRAVAPPTGEHAVILPPDVLPGILPPVLGFRFTGAARMRQIAPEVGSPIAAERVTLRDEGDYPWSPGSAPFDDEGAPRGRHALIEGGKVGELLYDSLYASALASRSTASASRGSVGPTGPMRFAHAPGPGPSTLVLAPGTGGSLAELAEVAGDGVLVTQLGWARPDTISGVFGGEIRIGYRIRHGKIAEPVRGGTVGGTVMAPPGQPSLLANLEAVGKSPELVERLVSPPILIRPLSVAGA